MHVRFMIQNARRWATARGLIRTNPVHGLEEYKIPKKEKYLFRNQNSQSSTQKTSFLVQAGKYIALHTLGSIIMHII